MVDLSPQTLTFMDGDVKERLACCCRSIQRQAEAVSNALRLQLWGAELVEMPPASTLPHRCSVVVLRGAVTLTTAGATPSHLRPAAGNRQNSSSDTDPQVHSSASSQFHSCR